MSGHYRQILHLSDTHIHASGKNMDKLEDTCHVVAENFDPSRWVILITGDVVEGATNLNRRIKECENARIALQPLLRRGFDVQLVPGNHDYGLKGINYHADARERYHWLHRDVCGYHPSFPVLRDYEAWGLVLLDSNMLGSGEWARGRLGEAQLRRLEAQLTQTTMPLVVALHHHPTEASGTLKLLDADEFMRVLRRRIQPVTLCCGHKHSENLRMLAEDGLRGIKAGALEVSKSMAAMGKGNSSRYRAICIDPVRQTARAIDIREFVEPALGRLIKDRVRVKELGQSSRRDYVFNSLPMASGCLVQEVQLVRVDRQGETIMAGPSREITVGPGSLAGARIIQDSAGTNSPRVVVRAWNGSPLHLYYRLLYQVTGGSQCTIDEGAEVMDRVRTRPARQGSRRTHVFNHRLMPQGCQVVDVNLIRVDAAGRRIAGPSRELTVNPGDIAGAHIVEDGRGTNSLRVVVRDWNGMPVRELHYRLVYTISGGAHCRL